jgi:hypothetical protein
VEQDAATTTDSAQPGGRARAKGGRTAGDLVRSLAVVTAVVVVLVVLNYRAPQDPVREIDAGAVAQGVAQVAPFPVLLPGAPGWRATSARFEPTPESAGVPVWFAGGVFSAQGPFAAVVQSAQASPDFLAEQTKDGREAGTSVVAGAEWARYESERDRSLVLRSPAGVTIATGSGSWAEVEGFAASLAPVPATD